MIGTDSPVSIDSLTITLPYTITKSHGDVSPSFKITTSPNASS